MNYLDSLNLQYMWTQNLNKNIFSVLFLSLATSSLYSWQSLSLYTATEVYNLSMATTN